jgi:hypothetical protein
MMVGLDNDVKENEATMATSSFTTINNHQQPSTTINNHQQPSTTINNHQQPSSTTAAVL